MTDLIVMLSTGKGTWAHVSALMRAEKWDNVYLITNNFGKEKFTVNMPVQMIILDDSDSVEQMRDKIIKELKDKLKIDVAVNFVSGSGEEHMALLSALVKLGVGLHLVIEDQGLKEL